MHIPVLTGAVLEYLAVRPDGIYIDATCGMGSHSAAIAERLTSGWVLANDRDAESLELARSNTARLGDRIRFHHGPFSALPEALKEHGIAKASGLVADLNVSRFQLTTPQRGFSLMADGPLDMRYSRDQETTAADIVNTFAEKALADLIYRFGAERRSRKIARALVLSRPFRTTLQLARVIEKVAPRTGRLHPATRTFMALRIAVNDEMGELGRLLQSVPELVLPGGRAVIISYHSLEDTEVKHSFQGLAKDGRARLLTRHVVKPSRAEIRANPASRSARLRAVEIT